MLNVKACTRRVRTGTNAFTQTAHATPVASSTSIERPQPCSPESPPRASASRDGVELLRAPSGESVRLA
eukprot:scaffold5311_cov120-Isochrysis_galbana.AAC.5